MAEAAAAHEKRVNGVKPPPGAEVEVQMVGGRKYYIEKLPAPVLPALAVPPSVGRGLATFLAGSYCPDARQWVRRPNMEYPDFRKVAIEHTEDDAEVEAAKALINSGHGSGKYKPIATGPVGTALEPPPVLKFPATRAHRRLKDEVKTHMEHANSSGKIMLRGGKL